MLSVQLRVGLGHDTHRLMIGRRLVLGGVPIEHDRGLVGHSDADALLHAVTDALLGAAGLGDIGEWFPNDDPKWAGADSALFITEAVREVRSRDWQIINVDCTVWAEQPRLTPYKPAIQRRLGELLEIDIEQVNVKAKSGERVGPVGREEAIFADAVVLLGRLPEV
jgi:2-C-methyl-D-erythritol 2,4-cyclodiphosphate synthase